MSTFDFGAIRPITHEVTELYIEKMVNERGLPYKHYYKNRWGEVKIKKIDLVSFFKKDINFVSYQMNNDFELGPTQRKLWQEYFPLFLRRDVEKNITILIEAGLKVGCDCGCAGTCEVATKTLEAATTLLKICGIYADSEEIIVPPTHPRMLETLPAWLAENVKGLEKVDRKSLAILVLGRRECYDIGLIREQTQQTTFTSEEDGIPTFYR
jgi:hypothetical protein